MGKATLCLAGTGDPAGLARAAVLALIDHGLAPDAILQAAADLAGTDLIKAHVHPGGEQPPELAEKRVAALTDWYERELLPAMQRQIDEVIARGAGHAADHR